jgi:phage baseplate assembly protein V
VRIDELVTGDTAWFTPRAGATRIWSPRTVGEQCLLICSDGDTQAGVALLGLFSDSFPPPSSGPLDLVEFGDGAVLFYDPATHELLATLPAGGKVTITAPRKVTLNVPGGAAINGPLTVNGTIAATGIVSSDADVKAAGISLCRRGSRPRVLDRRPDA